jgi:DNA-binding PucR family transcriptional regulator
MLAESVPRLQRVGDRRLAALEELTPKARARALATLRAHLDNPGDAPRMAAALDIHPQTVRYRMARLREALGDQLDDPDARFELAAVLRGVG